MKNTIHILLNPVAGGGKGALMVDPLTKYLDTKWPGKYEIIQTKAVGDAIQLAGEIGKDDHNLLIVVGGDGTISEVVNGLLNEQDKDVKLRKFGVVNCGSGAGFSQSLGLPPGLEAQIDLIEAGKSIPLDVGVVEYTDAQGVKQQRYFISECQIGIGGAIVSRVGLKQKRFGGKVAFGTASVAEIFHYKATNMTIRTDHQAPVQKSLIGIALGNGRYTAGGMQLTPTAILNDGFLDFLTIEEMGLIHRLSAFSKVYAGDHIKTPYCHIQPVHEIQIDSDVPVWIEADGELLGKTPCHIKILPAAMRVFSPLK